IDNDIPRMIVGSGGEILGTKDMNYYFNNFTFITLAGGDYANNIILKNVILFFVFDLESLIL
ncbi:MAG: hypothetical protein ACFFG0_29425, partial [Candidatus Thorarchaeota archaeon]